MIEYSLDQWRTVMSQREPAPSKNYIVIAFPTDEIKRKYLEHISEWPESEIFQILANMLGDSRSLTWLDRIHFEHIQEYGPISSRSDRDLGGRQFTEYERRVILAATGQGDEPVWPSLTWVLDLLPPFPQIAIDAISAYVLAHAQQLSDLRLAGLDDATAVIRYRYIIQDPAARLNKISFLRSLDPSDIEYLAAALYAAMGYKTQVTPQQKDGGIDVVASKDDEVVYIECKNWEERVDVETVRSFTSTVFTEPATRGIFISISGFTERGPMSAKQWIGAPMRQTRIKLIDGQDLVQLLNEFLGLGWNSKVDRIIASEKAKVRDPKGR